MVLASLLGTVPSVNLLYVIMGLGFPCQWQLIQKSCCSSYIHIFISGSRKEELGNYVHFPTLAVCKWGFKGNGGSRLLFWMHCVLIKKWRGFCLTFFYIRKKILVNVWNWCLCYMWSWSLGIDQIIWRNHFHQCILVIIWLCPTKSYQYWVCFLYLNNNFNWNILYNLCLGCISDFTPESSL